MAHVAAAKEELTRLGLETGQRKALTLVADSVVERYG